ncbi:MAG: FAD-dependent oxidoreductase [Akkermansiaceae bacterium]
MILRCLLATALSTHLHAASFLVEAEQFANKGGWKVDTQFIESMGSPYLIAHGLGKPVEDATTEVAVTEAGDYRVWVRTLDWTKRLKRPDSAGKFSLSVNGKTLETVLGETKPEWNWQLAGNIQLKPGKVKLALHDLTGFNGRADAILFSNDSSFTPPESASFEERTKWDIQGVPSMEEDAGSFDLVVVGGGYGGLGSAISAARMGAKVALIQNRDVLGGNGSSEIRVWAKGNYPPNEYPFDEIIREIEDQAKASPSHAEEFVDDKKEKVVRAEENISLFLGHHAYGVELKDGEINAVKVVDIDAGKIKRISGKYFADCTGHAFVAMWAGADTKMTEKGRMGMSNMWIWENQKKAVEFPHQTWMHEFDSEDFPYPKKRHGFGHAEWFWESGYDNHPINELEHTRDLNLLASFSAWSAIKNRGAHAKRDEQAHKNAEMTWMAYIGGTRETQQVLGDVILTGDDIEGKKPFDDATFRTTWSIDLHYPRKEYIDSIPGTPFIARAVHGKGIDRKAGYQVPYRTLYSRNVPNLFMAGRNISVEREALGTIRVMKTIGMMGVTVGRAAALATLRDCSPREIYENHLDEVKRLWKMPGAERFANLEELKNALDEKTSDPKPES